MGRFTGILGLLTMLGLAYAFSTNRKAIRLKTVAWGLGLQIVFAIFVLKVDAGRRLFQAAGAAVNRLLAYSFEGSKFVFGELGKQGSSLGFYFAFQVLPTIIFIAAFFAVLYHFGVMQFIIKQVAKLMTRVMGASGAESLNVAASIFMGQTEAPLTIRPFLADLTQSELNHGGVYCVRDRSQTPPERSDYDCPRHAPHGQNASTGNGAAKNRRASGDERGGNRGGEK
jgi:CNT family concentrative nucleoside transporter